MPRRTGGPGGTIAARPAEAPAPTQRIDRFLWFARLAGSRSAAQTLAERAVIRLNGRRIDRAHAPVRPGDIITMPQGMGVVILRILHLPARRGPAPEARQAYELIQPGMAAPGDVSRSIDIDDRPRGA